MVKASLNFDFEPINNRLCVLRYKNESLKHTLICAYAPTLINSEKFPDIRNDFYTQLESLISNEPNNSILIIGGDFNAKTGSGYTQFNKNMGPYGKGILNSNGNHLLELANRNNLVLTNTTFKHKLAHRATWVSSCNYKNRRNPVRNQIDYMLVRISHLKCVLDSRSYSGLFLDTDHRMVITKIKITDKRNNFHKLRVERNNLNSINIDNLGNQAIRREL